jgi:hypothetical protein
MTMKLIHKTLLAIGLTTGLATGGFAFANGPHDGAAHDPAQFAAHMQEQRTAHLTQLHDKLNLQANQEAAWTAFVAATTPTPPTTPPADQSNLPAPQRLENMLNMLKAHETVLAGHLQAVKTFYATLSPEQQKIFDDSFKHMHHGKGPRHG